MLLRNTKEFTFDLAHILPNYDGKCKNIHGHTYKLQVTIIGTPCEDEHSPKYGMILDFSDLKKAVTEPIVNHFDHALVVPQGWHSELKDLQENGKFIEVPFQPTCENLTAHFAKIIKVNLPKNVKLHSVRLYETPTSFSEWFAEDNQ